MLTTNRVLLDSLIEYCGIQPGGDAPANRIMLVTGTERLPNGPFYFVEFEGDPRPPFMPPMSPVWERRHTWTTTGQVTA